MKPEAKFQIGKQGLTENFIFTLKNSFKERKAVKIQVLKSKTREKEKVEEIGEEIVEKLGKNYVYKVMGFVIFIKKFRKAVR